MTNKPLSSAHLPLSVVIAIAMFACLPPIGEAAKIKVAKDHLVPVEKKLADSWVKSLYAKGGSTFYEGDDLDTIGMPIGGVACGHICLTGDGRLAHWDVMNQRFNTGHGRECYNLGRRITQLLDQGVAVQINDGTGSMVRSLSREGFAKVRFCGEYPLGMVEYSDPHLPVAVKLEAFSPFIPLNDVDSCIPVTVLKYTVTNTSKKPIEVTLAEWLQNGVSMYSGKEMAGERENGVTRTPGMTMVTGTARATQPPIEPRKPRVLADFEGTDYGDWTVEGEAFGKGPVKGEFPYHGYEGKRLASSHPTGGKARGRLLSPEFTIDRPYLCFLQGGGKYRGKVCINLLVDGKVVQSMPGHGREYLLWKNWEVKRWQGARARIEILDNSSRSRGSISVDQIELCDLTKSARTGSLTDQEDSGSLTLAVLGSEGEILTSRALPDGDLPANLFDGKRLAESDRPKRPIDEKLRFAVAKRISLAPGQSRPITFITAWHFPRRRPVPQVWGKSRSGDRNYYANRFDDASSVARYVAKNLPRLEGQTRLWHETWYDSTLPHWALDRLFATTATLATSTVQRWQNGRFWGWEGVGSCPGTCTHVWNYEHAVARLFPEMERSIREMQDFDAGFVESNGMVCYRGECRTTSAADGQAGTILKSYREHLISPDDKFLRRNWPHIQKALEYLIRQDGNEDGLIEGQQHNTYDVCFYGANTMVGSLYLGALRAGEAMADEMGDREAARRYRRIWQSGSKRSIERVFNGEYFHQAANPAKVYRRQYFNGCLSDQLFGQGWAHQVGLGYIYPEKLVRIALKSVWRYNWAPDVWPQNKVYQPERWFAHPGEAGLFICTWPQGDRPEAPMRYRNEVWTGIEYQVAGHMAWEGMVTKTLAICRAIHDRYHPSKHNPWNEVECGDFYARGLAGYGVFLGLCGFEYHGPRGHLAFAPRITPDDFRAAFTAAEGWGTISQTRAAGKQTNRVKVRWGKLRLNSLGIELPEGTRPEKITLTATGGRESNVAFFQKEDHVTLKLGEPLVLKAGEEVLVEVHSP